MGSTVKCDIEEDASWRGGGKGNENF